MTREELKGKILSVRDLRERWHYRSTEAVRKRLKYDKKFPEPLTLVNGRFPVFWLPDIEEYERERGGIDGSNNRFTFYQTREEWEKLPEDEKKERANPFFKDL